MNTILLYCRPGFESECAQEIQARCAEIGLFGYAKTQPQSAYVVFQTQDEDGAAQAMRQLDFDSLIFARQWLAGGELLADLDPTDRLGPILEAARALDTRFSEVQVEAADTNAAKELLVFCKKFTSPLVAGLKRADLLKPKAPLPRLHVFFLTSTSCYVGYARSDNSSPWFMGIPRLRFPKDAPSRSTLKLEEAWHQFIPAADWDELLAGGMKAVDLGAAPGGWTWQLVKRSMFVTAIDNGPMDKGLMDGGQVEHLRVDGFKYKPPKRVDWVVCDMVEQPARIAELITRWVAHRYATRAIFNLKLPMKKRWAELERCRELIEDGLVEAGAKYRLRIKQLYHDREEVTCYLVRLD
ncbi:MAG: 23S rRNA (cytidine(2498)-2'-O)-methyltransferase RlmM [Gammaproteobacteria bacterium]|nr:23S rRNA (cytidine(2498)-2'-O)-methyltransferase RlmM [Gammaproteobacteria bacterium]